MHLDLNYPQRNFAQWKRIRCQQDIQQTENGRSSEVPTHHWAGAAPLES